MRAFVVRPFGEQNGVDFNRVHRELIKPALAALKIEGDTTEEIAQAGNIRRDMFKLLAVADLVIADLSIHNANVFYELGIRHAVRDRRTFLIRANVDKVPFDLLTDRYLLYDKDNPGAAVKALVAGLQAAIDSDDVDSPVISLMQQELVTPVMSRLLAPPADFHEEVHRAAKEGRPGDLSLLAEEAGRLLWAREGLRRVGTAQFELASWEPTRITWERVREGDANDVEANGRLATIYQKLGDLAKADEAVERVLGNLDVRGPERAELESLRASNRKTRWTAEWTTVDDAGQRAQRALRSPWIASAYDGYWTAFADDRNHFYSGLNALAMVTILLELAERLPDVWFARYDSDEEARRAREAFATQRTQLAAAVELACQGAQRAVTFSGRPDKWLDISTADLVLLTRMAPERVANRYRRALADGQRFHLAAARRQLTIFERLGVLSESATAALAVIDELEQALPPDPQVSSPARLILFSGHRIDKPGRTPPRFPKEAEGEARRMIAEAVAAEREKAGGEVAGIAGGASGGDILFHEVCAEQGIKTQLFIIGSRDTYVKESVQDGGPQWVERFNRLHDTLPSRVLGNSQGTLDLPRWLKPAKNYSIWERSNRWMLNNALAYGAKKVTLLALWNKEIPPDGAGGTQDMVTTAQERGAKVVVLDAAPLARMRDSPPAGC
jgi:tetratricopeptide repeat protein